MPLSGSLPLSQLAESWVVEEVVDVSDEPVPSRTAGGVLGGVVSLVFTMTWPLEVVAGPVIPALLTALTLA